MVRARGRCHDDRMLAAGERPWIRDLDHLDALGSPAVVTGPDGEVLYANQQAVRLHLVREAPGVSVSEALLPQADGPLLEQILRQSLAGHPWSGPLDVRRADGSSREAEVACTPVRHLGEVVALLFVVGHEQPEPDGPGPTSRLQERLTRLARVTAELGTAEDVATVTEIVVSHAADAVGATTASLSLVVDDDTLALAGLRGGREGAARRWATYSRHDHTPAADVVRTGTQLLLTGRAAIERAYPGLEHASDGERSILALPLKVVGRTIGVTTLSFPGHRHLDSAELEFFGILADSCAQAVERVRADEAAHVQSARLRFLAEATQRLSQSLDYERTLTEVARLAVPGFADWCAIDLVEDDRLHRLAVQHVDPAKVQLALDLERRYPSDRNASGGAWQVIRTRPAAAQRPHGAAARAGSGARRPHLGRRRVGPHLHPGRPGLRRGLRRPLCDRDRQLPTLQRDPRGGRPTPGGRALRPDRRRAGVGARRVLQPRRAHRRRW
jgi:GAF domain-containing protein